jgi:glycosyltransferase involved in cell wall biosynthesis
MNKIAVLIPNYNNAAYIRQCLESVRAQTQGDWEAVVGDNASTDESVAIVESLGDRRIRVVRRPRTIGWVANVNLLLSEGAGSQYIAVLHSDDWWEPKFLQTMRGLLEANPTSILATSAVHMVGDGLAPGVRGLHEFRILGASPTCNSAEATRALTRRSCIFAPGVLARAELYRRLGGYEESLPQACDWLMWLRAAAEATIEVWDQPLASYRSHEGNMTGQLTLANLKGIDLVRLVLLVRSLWTGREPFRGACRRLARTVVTELLADAARRFEGGDRLGAETDVHLARAVAPTIDQVALTSLAQWAIRAAALPGSRQAQPYLLSFARHVWHAVERPASMG